MLYQNRTINEVAREMTECERMCIQQKGHDAMKQLESNFCFFYAPVKCMFELELKTFEVFYHIWAWWPYWSCDLFSLNIFCSFSPIAQCVNEVYHEPEAADA